MKICVYAISKNEEQFVERWVNSMKEADEIYVLDTGSTDKTVEKLKTLGVHVKEEIITPWRFDVARNHSLELVPKDTTICVCTDLDEVMEKGWRKKLEEKWKANITRARYNYNWSFNEYQKPKVNFYIEKIHAREGYIWKHPVHEVLIPTKEEVFITLDNLTVNHYPDQTKSRSSYLPLLELSVKEDPEDDRNMHYLGREYMYYQKWNEAIDTLIRHLNLKSATWKDERSASMRFIARSYQALKRPLEAKMWLEKAKEETPYLREPWMESALLYYQEGNFKEAKYNVLEALKIKEHTKSYINEPFCYDSTPYDLLSLCYYQEKEYDKAIYYLKKAIELNPSEERLKKNLEIIQQEKKN